LFEVHSQVEEWNESILHFHDLSYDPFSFCFADRTV
jgi:hypothetical protein